MFRCSQQLLNPRTEEDATAIRRELAALMEDVTFGEQGQYEENEIGYT